MAETQSVPFFFSTELMTHSESSTSYNEAGNTFLWRAQLRGDERVRCASLSHGRTECNEMGVQGVSGLA